MKSIVLLFCLFLVISSCEESPSGYKYNQGSLPTAPVNLSDFNTPYDDFNSTAPVLGGLIPFCFSTNRKSFNQQEFDVIFKPLSIVFDKTSGELEVSDEIGAWRSKMDYYEFIHDGMRKIKSEGNEFGPNLLVEQDFNEYLLTLMYSSDTNGNSDIFFISSNPDSQFSEPKEVTFLNSEFDDLYPTFNIDKSSIYLCSNRDGEMFNIYFTSTNPNAETLEILNNTENHIINLNTSLSSISNDKCPFIYENIMVFASDRAGGFGGYDLYYSKYEGGTWGTPVNFGSEINSEFDEFRPILVDEGVSIEQTMMIFSSNRTGGQGGFDLYFVGTTIE